MSTPEEQLNTLLQLQETLTKDHPTNDDVMKLFEMTLRVVKAMKEELDQVITTNKDDAGTSVEDVKDILKDIGVVTESTYNRVTSLEGTSAKHTGNFEAIAREFYLEGQRIERRIPSVPSLEPLTQRIAKLERSLPEGLQLFITQTRTRLQNIEDELGTDDDRFKKIEDEVHTLWEKKADKSSGFGGGGITRVSAGTNIAVIDDPNNAGFRKVILDIPVQTTAPASPVLNQLWIDSS